MNERSSRAAVLLVEDNPDHALFARRALEAVESGFTVQVAERGSEALALVERGFDVLVVDYSLPDMTGLQLVESCRERGVDAPAVLVTAMGSERVASDALRAGLADYLVKGDAFWELIPVIAERVVRQARDVRRLASLEQCMLDVTSAQDVESTALSIARSARTLLAADAAAVWCEDDERPRGVDGVWDPERPVIARDLVSNQDRRVGRLHVGFGSEKALSANEEHALNLFVQFSGAALQNAVLLAQERANVARLTELDRLKDEFLSTVSHELLTPLTVIHGFADTLVEHWREIAEPQRRTFLLRLRGHADELSELIQRLLEFTRTGLSRVPDATEVDLDETLGAVLERPDGGRVVRAVGDHRVRASRDAVQSILANLVSNALKYSPPDTPVEVRAWREDGYVTIAVEDRGPGVPLEERESIFHRFVRGQGAGSVRGMGIGLAIVARHAAAYGGRAWIEPRPGGGSSFRVTLPAVGEGSEGMPPHALEISTADSERIRSGR